MGQKITWTQLDDSDFADNLVLFPYNHQQMQDEKPRMTFILQVPFGYIDICSFTIYNLPILSEKTLKENYFPDK